jgi:hypothetical protein
MRQTAPKIPKGGFFSSGRRFLRDDVPPRFVGCPVMRADSSHGRRERVRGVLIEPQGPRSSRWVVGARA